VVRFTSNQDQNDRRPILHISSTRIAEYISPVEMVRFVICKSRNPHKRTSWKLVGNPGHELVAN